MYCVGQVLHFQVCLSARIFPVVDKKDTVLSGVTLNFVDCALIFVSSVKKSQQRLVYDRRSFLNAYPSANCSWILRNWKKYEPACKNAFYSMAEPARQFSLWVFDNFGKVHVSIEHLAVRIMYVDPDRLLFMFDKPILIFRINVVVFFSTHRQTRFFKWRRILQKKKKKKKKKHNPALLDRISVTTGYPALQLDAVN